MEWMNSHNRGSAGPSISGSFPFLPPERFLRHISDGAVPDIFLLTLICLLLLSIFLSVFFTIFILLSSKLSFLSFL